MAQRILRDGSSLAGSGLTTLSHTLESREQPCRDGLRLGIFGGTFDPVHLGHLIVAEEAGARLALDRVIFTPARLSPFKMSSTFFSAQDRFRMVELAIADNPHFSVSPVELARTAPSYTVDTIRALRARHGERAALFFVMGLDSLVGFAAWHRPEEIIRLARLIVINRPGVSVDWSDLERAVPGIRQASEVIDTVNIGISSTDIRERLRQGLPIRYQVPDAVESYIRDKRLIPTAETPTR